MIQHSTISFATSDGLHFFNPHEIVRLEAISNYTKIYFANNKKLVSSKVLKTYVKMLEPFGFVRTHRTHLVKRHHIVTVTSHDVIIMKDASVASISRRMRGQVMKQLTAAA